MSSLRVTQVTAEHDFAALGELWQQLAAQDVHAGIFNDWQWNKLWWEHYAHLGQLLVLLVYNDQQLVGIGPFYRTQSKALGIAMCDTVRFIGSGGSTSPDDLNILALDSLRQPITDAICNHLLNANELGRLLLTDVNIDTVFYQTFITCAMQAKGYLVEPVYQSRRWSSLPAKWADYRNQISRNTHKQMKRRQNRLDSVGEATMQVCTTKHDIDEAFAALVSLHSARWQSKGQGGSFGIEQYRAFHFALVEQLHKLNQVWLVTLKLNNKIIGVEYAYLYKGTLMFFQTGFDPAHQQLSPGHVLMTFAIQQAIKRGATRIDLLKGDYEYKSSYANAIRQSATLGFYRRGLFSLLAWLNDLRLKFKR